MSARVKWHAIVLAIKWMRMRQTKKDKQAINNGARDVF
jgi:hypothetical protein